MKIPSIFQVQRKSGPGRAFSLLKVLQLVSIAGLSLFALSVRAAPVTLVGETVSYVYDDSQSALLLFGVPAIQGDVIRFLPASFRAQSLNGAAADLVSADFQFSRVYSNTGRELNYIEVYEFGDYEIMTANPSMPGSIQAGLSLMVSNNNDFTEFATASDSISGGMNLGLQTFELTAGINPMAEFDSNASDVALSINNSVFAVTNASGDVAWVQKKLAFAAVSQVPIPAAAWLFGSALFGLVVVQRRKAQL